jgi:hypothetical protein
MALCLSIRHGLYKTHANYLIHTSVHISHLLVGPNVDERGLFHVLIEGIRQAVGDPYTMDPIIAGMRLKDNKYRNIFIDSIANYFRETRVFKRLFEQIEELKCNVAEHHYDVADEIVQLHGVAAYGGDYKGMDWHYVLLVLFFTLDIAQDLFNIPQHEVDEMKRVLESICNAEIVVGQEIFKSVWNMLSGIYPTHDLESLLNLAIVSTALSSLGIRVVLTPRKLKSREAYVKVCGDDIVVVFGKAHPTKEQMTAKHAYYAQAVGQVLEVSKADWVTLGDQQGIFFCKRFYALSQNTSGYKQVLVNGRQVPIPKYSIEKALNGLYHPEHIPSFTDRRSLVYWTQAVMDNAAGHTAFPRICYELFQSNPLFNDKSLIEYIPNQDDYLILLKKWNVRQYGILDKSQSPFWTLLLKYLANK